MIWLYANCPIREVAKMILHGKPPDQKKTRRPLRSRNEGLRNSTYARNMKEEHASYRTHEIHEEELRI